MNGDPRHVANVAVCSAIERAGKFDAGVTLNTSLSARITTTPKASPVNRSTWFDESTWVIFGQ